MTEPNEVRTALLAGLSKMQRQLDEMKGNVTTLLHVLGADETTPEAVALRCAIENGDKKIAAIKQLRTETGMGLKEAKDAIDAAYLTLDR